MELIVDEEYVPSLWLYSALDRKDTMFLDSSMHNELGRYSYIGLIPFKEYLPDDSDAVAVLNGIDDDTLMGLIGYDYGMKLIGCESRHHPSRFPSFILADFDVIIKDDIENRVLIVECKGRVMPAEDEMKTIMDLIHECDEPVIPEISSPISVKSTDKKSFMDSVKRAKELERKGEFYVINLSRRIVVESCADPFDVFLRLRNISPSPFGGFMSLDGITIISSSMELLLDIEDGKAWTRPIKGTVPHGDDETDNRRNLDALLTSSKDRSELLMVTDMERNDLNRFCIPGSVRVNGFFKPEEYSTVYHTVADVSGEIEDARLGHIVECVFPGGSVSGAPKKACIDYIDELEDSVRGPYTGSMGLFSRKKTVMNILIRTMAHKNGTYEIGVGGGITYESDESSEYEETVQKSKALMMALGADHGI